MHVRLGLQLAAAGSATQSLHSMDWAGRMAIVMSRTWSWYLVVVVSRTSLLYWFKSWLKNAVELC